MSKDIRISVNTGDVSLVGKNEYKTMDFQWVGNPGDLSAYLYGEVTISVTTTDDKIRERGFYITIPYTPTYKPFKIKIKRADAGSHGSYLINKKDGTQWFSVTNAEGENVIVSELATISKNNDFLVKFKDETIVLYAARYSDFLIGEAKHQNTNCLLACNPGNNYRYPLSGVGLVRWINSNEISTNNLANVIQREFSEDGMAVRSAYYNYDTQKLELSVEEQEQA